MPRQSQVGTNGWVFKPKRIISVRNVVVYSSELVARDTDGPGMHMQVCLYTCGDLIASVPFFENSEEGFTTSLVTLLRPAVRMPPIVQTMWQIRWQIMCYRLL